MPSDAGLPRHKFWGAGEPDCPREIKAGNGELHTLRCRRCGQDSPRDDACPVGLVEKLTAIFSERRPPGTRNGPITEPRALAEYVVANLTTPKTGGSESNG